MVLNNGVDAPGERWAENPFFVLELTPGATRPEVERAAAKLLSMIEIGMKAAALYPTPLGPRARTPELVRLAIAELRDPERRAMHEAWWVDPTPTTPDDASTSPPRGDATAGFTFDAPSILGWRP